MPRDPKQAERDYWRNLGAEGLRHAGSKPFSDDLCGQYLANLTALFLLMEPPPARIVEFGCGSGWLSFLLGLRGYAVLGVDIAEEAIAQARRARDERGCANVDFAVADYESFAPAGRFDYAIFHDALHHASDEEMALRCACAALRPGGAAIVIEPGRGHSAAASSRRAIETWGVTEKDMPPSHVVAVAKRAGFRRHLVLPSPHQHNLAFYRRTYHRYTSAWDFFGRRVLASIRAFRRNLFDRDHGLVILWK